MKKIAAVIIDTYAGKRMPRHALEQALKIPNLNSVYTFSTSPIMEGENFFRIRPIESLEHYSDIVLNVLPNVILEDFALVVQWDGVAHNPNSWSDDFLDFDYIGAPWSDEPESRAVGNGGFSLRSQRQLAATKRIPIQRHAGLEKYDAEDVVLCRYYRSMLECFGVKFAPPDIARRFAYETGPITTHLGFHGSHNFPFFLSEAYLSECAGEIVERCSNNVMLAVVLINAQRRGYMELCLALSDKIMRDETLRQEIANILVGAKISIPNFTS